ncbi:MAG: saccharopine dehydrogenase [Alphaproteobacteria bacterium]|nr:MAG: saccharopine dehydrogenase [Alphaproteobacteria bacterium]
MTKEIIWLRRETRITERRTPLLPEGARSLIKEGYEVLVEKSVKRIIPDQAYADAGCRMVEGGSWIKAPKDAFILGLKELPGAPDHLRNNHIYFAHAYKEQAGWQDLLSRFISGGGRLLDIEYMVDQNGGRVVAFGFWAGYMGAALALIHWYNQNCATIPYLDKGLTPFNNADALKAQINAANTLGKKPKVLIIGAGGRCGQGALKILGEHGAEITCWGRKMTNDIDRAALLEHDILINCAFIIDDVPSFLRQEDLKQSTRLSVVADVSCDPYSAFNPIPLYHETTSWEKPYITVKSASGDKSIDIIAIDNLPSLLPQEASQEFSSQILPHLKTLNKMANNPIWLSAQKSFDDAISRIKPTSVEKTQAA